jgi:1-phosphofructokinase family hexose kinase
VIVTVTLNPSLDRTLIVPEIRFNEVLRATANAQNAAGKGLNVTRALQRLGLESTATGFIGGRTGQMLVDDLEVLGIRHDFVPVAGETRTNIVILEGDSKTYIKVNEAGPTITAENQQAFLDKITHVAAPGDQWVFSGSLPPGVPPDFYQTLVSAVQERGAQAFLDSSGESLHAGSEAAPYLVKPNHLEAEEVSGILVEDEAGAARAARYFLNRGVHLVALSLGSDGMLLASNEESVRVHCPVVTLRNPTGSGDALLAGLLFGLSHQLPLEEVARWGVASGSAAAAREDTSFGDLSEVSALFDRTG